MICGYIENVNSVPYIVLLMDRVICQDNVLTLWNTSSVCCRFILKLRVRWACLVRHGNWYYDLIWSNQSHSFI